MKQYRATAYNKNGYTFQFLFMAVNWNGIEQVAHNTLEAIVMNDKLHQLCGPWAIRNIDVGG